MAIGEGSAVVTFFISTFRGMNRTKKNPKWPFSSANCLPPLLLARLVQQKHQQLLWMSRTPLKNHSVLFLPLPRRCKPGSHQRHTLSFPTLRRSVCWRVPVFHVTSRRHPALSRLGLFLLQTYNQRMQEHSWTRTQKKKCK